MAEIEVLLVLDIWVTASSRVSLECGINMNDGWITFKHYYANVSLPKCQHDCECQ